jgi:hypothetical protein
LQNLFYGIILATAVSSEDVKNVEFFSLQNISIIFQLILLAAQIFLAWQVFIVDKGAKKGYFLPSKTNISMPQEYAGRFNDVYDLKKPIGFKNYGEDDVVVTRTKTILNQHTVDYSIVDSNAFYDNKGRFSFLNLKLDLKQNDLDKDLITVDVILSLKNSKDYKYIQKIAMEFQVESGSSYWRLIRFNTEFSKS